MSSGMGIGKTLVSVDWTKALTRCFPQVRKGVTDLRARHEDLNRQIYEAQSNVPKLNFDYYKSKLPANEYGGMLSEMEGKIKGFQPKKIDYSGQLKSLEAEEQEQIKEAAEFLNQLDGNVTLLSTQLEKLNNAKPVDDVYALNPEFKEEIYNGIKNDNWATDEDKEDLIAQKAHH